MSIVINILLVFEVLICLLLILLVLMQRPKNEGLGAAFGGGMTENIFGAQTTSVLQTTTRNLGIAFFIISAALGWLSVRANAGKSSIQNKLGLAPVPALATPAPPPATPPLGGTERTTAESEAVKVPPPPKLEDDKKPEPSKTDGDAKSGPGPAPVPPAPAPPSDGAKPAGAKPADAPAPEGAPKPAEPVKE
jgi:preprotein translocase subunit SecG